MAQARAALKLKGNRMGISPAPQRQSNDNATPLSRFSAPYLTTVSFRAARVRPV
jgi:hypothetical protein